MSDQRERPILNKNSISIGVENLSKAYRLYKDPSGRLKESLLRGRKKYHREFWALQNINLEVSRGETLGLIGRNGCGKSTLLQLIAGIVTPTAGQLQVNGRVSALLELGSGFDPEFTGRENAFMNGAILGIEREEIEHRFSEIERFAEIGDFIDQPVKLYSSGMYVRLAFATAISVDPDVLLVDEALAVGDIVFQHRCMSKIREIQENGKTIVFVSHDMGAVQKLCTRALLMEKGKTVALGEPEAVIGEYYKIIFDIEEKYKPVDTAPERLSESAEDTVAFEAVNHYDKRFGSRKGEIIGFSLTDEHGRKLDSFTWEMTVIFSMFVKCHEDIQMPMAGLVVRDLLGHELIRTNTDAEGTCLKAHRKGDLVKISFSFAVACFKAGSYAISAGFGNGTLEQPSAYDWIENLCVFVVEADKICYGIVRIPVEIDQILIQD